MTTANRLKQVEAIVMCSKGGRRCQIQLVLLMLNLTSDVMPREQTTTNIMNGSASEVRHKKALSLRQKENKKVRNSIAS